MLRTYGATEAQWLTVEDLIKDYERENNGQRNRQMDSRQDRI